jgi:hypothetical protein
MFDRFPCFDKGKFHAAAGKREETKKTKRDTNKMKKSKDPEAAKAKEKIKNEIMNRKQPRKQIHTKRTFQTFIYLSGKKLVRSFAEVYVPSCVHVPPRNTAAQVVKMH